MELNKTFEEMFPASVKICESLLDKLSLNGRYMCPGLVSAYGVPVRLWGGGGTCALELWCAEA